MKHLSLLQSQPSSIDELDKPHIAYIPNENTVYCYVKPNELILDEKIGFTPTNTESVFYTKVVFKRTFKTDTLATFCYPINLSKREIENTFGVGSLIVKIKGLSQEEDGNYAIIGSKETHTEAGVPYLFKPTYKDINGNDLPTKDATEQVFYNKILPIDCSAKVLEVSKDDLTVKCIGTYVESTFYEGCLLLSGGQLKHVNKGGNNKVYGFRCWWDALDYDLAHKLVWYHFED